jgi:Holliday junction resolvase RusA-like endonuclease
MPRLVVSLPVPPSVNARLVRGRRGHVVLSEAARQYNDEIAALLLPYRGKIPPKTPIALEVVFTYPNRRRDLDNILKQLVDALAQALEFDDAYVDTIIARKYTLSKAHPAVHVLIIWPATETNERSRR